MYIKNHDAWNESKKRFDSDDRKISIRAGEIRWAAIGVNVGSEIDGKGDSFTRPVLVVHVIGSFLALVIPLTTKVKETAGHYQFEWKGVTNALCIHQMRIVSQKRVLSRKGKISPSRLREIKTLIKDFYSF